MLGWSEEIRHCDVLVIGGGGAGLRTAIAAKLCDTDVLLVSKTKVGSTSNTYISKAVMASTGWARRMIMHPPTWPTRSKGAVF